MKSSLIADMNRQLLSLLHCWFIKEIMSLIYKLHAECKLADK